MGAAGRSPVEQGAGGTPLIGEEHLPSNSQILGNLECLTEKVGTLGLQATRRNQETAAVLPKSGQGRPSLWRLQLGTLAVANLGQLKAVSRRSCRSPAHLGLIKDEGSVWPD